jgi:hypothetical protein
MHYLVFTLALLWFVAVAPVKVAIAVCLSLILITSVVKATATTVIGETSFSDSFKSVSLAFVFLAIALLGMITLSKGADQGMPAVLVLPAFLVAYVFGFKVALGANFGSSAIIAGVSTAVSAALFFILKPLLS